MRVLLLPLLAALSYLLIFLIGQHLGRRNAEILAAIQGGYVPEVEMSYDLRRTLERIQRTLQDGVAAEDREALVQADLLNAEFIQKLEQGSRLPVANPAAYDELRRLDATFYASARRTSEHLISKDVRADPEDLTRVAQSSAALVSRLEADIARDKAQAAQAFAEAARLQSAASQLSGLVIGAWFALLALLSIWTVRSVVGPVQALTVVAGRIASEGDLAQKVPELGADEVGQLARSFRAVLERLRTVPISLQASAGQLKSAVTGLSHLSAQQAESAQAQAAALTEAAAGTTDLRNAASRAANDAARVMEVAAQAEKVGAEGQTSVESSLRGLTEIRDQINAIVQSIGDLSGYARRIGGVLEGVKDLSDQSNMLALNAAIIATKAGAEGADFAVIAREMRRLSNQSGGSMNESRRILDQIQQAIEATVNLTDRGAQRMEASIREIRSSGETLRKVTSFVDESSSAARQIATSVAEQAAAIEEISNVILDLNERVRDTEGRVGEMESALRSVDRASGAIVEVVESFRM
jgi:methyl-accepting chemotaxis protein